MKTFFTSLFSTILLSSTCSPVPFPVQSGASPSTRDTFQQSPASGGAPTSTPQLNSTQEKPSVKPAPAFEFGIGDGTPVSLTLARELSSAKESAGNRADFEVAEDVKVKGVVVIPKGGMVWGTIVDAKPKRRMGRAGRLDVRIDEVRLLDGERVPLRASQESKGKGRSGAMTGAIIASGVLFFPVAPMFLFMHGKDVIIAKGTPVTAYIDQNVALDQAKFSSPPPSAPPN